MRKFGLYGVCGNPILHSKSPDIMQTLFDEMSLNSVYTRIAVDSVKELENIAERLEIKAVNVTAPFKNEFNEEYEKDGLSTASKAVNTVIFENTRKRAYNTDVLGLIALIKAMKLKSGENIMVLGSGGAAKAAVYALNQLQLKPLVLARSAKALQELNEQFDCATAYLSEIGSYSENLRLCINTLPSELNVLHENYLNSNSIVLDAIYHNSSLKSLTQKAECMYIDGFQWLVAQALPAFEYFTGIDLHQQEYQFDFSKKLNSSAIALIGFMGVGKTTVGKELAKKLAYRFVDLDEEIERMHCMRIHELFKMKGEAIFRSLESNAMQDFLNEERIVISCGGGLAEMEINRLCLKEKSLCIWLDASVDYCLDGLDVSNRPLLQKKNKAAIAKELYKKRIENYAKASHLLVNAEGKTVEKLVEKIYEEISRTFGI